MARKNVYETDEGHPIEKTTVIAWAITRYEDSNHIYHKPIVADSMADFENGTKILEGSEIIDTVPAEPGTYRVSTWDADNGILKELGYEYPGASYTDWDTVIENKDITVDENYEYERAE